MKFHIIILKNFSNLYKAHLKLLFYLKKYFTKFLKNKKFHSIIFKNFPKFLQSIFKINFLFEKVFFTILKKYEIS